MEWMITLELCKNVMNLLRTINEDEIIRDEEILRAQQFNSTSIIGYQTHLNYHVCVCTVASS